MGITQDNPIGNNKDIVEMFQHVLLGFDLHLFVHECFGDDDTEYGDLAARFVSTLGIMVVMARKYPELEEQFTRIREELSTAQAVAEREIELTHFLEMDTLGLV